MALNYINDLTVDVLTIVLVVNKVPRVSSIMRFFKKKEYFAQRKTDEMRFLVASGPFSSRNKDFG